MLRSLHYLMKGEARIVRFECHDKKEDWMMPVRAATRQLAQFENLYKNAGGVENGFPAMIDLSTLENRDEFGQATLIFVASIFKNLWTFKCGYGRFLNSYELARI